MLVLFTDTDSDITPELAKKLNCQLISMPYTLEDKEVKPYVDFKEFDGKTFYNKLRSGLLPNTSALNPYVYCDYFEPFFKNGDDILYVHFSSAMSGTFNSMHIAINELQEIYPDRKFYEIDTKAITIGSMNPLLEIAQLYNDGRSIEEIMEWADREIDKFAIYFYAEDLQFFKHSGRVSGLAAFFGSIAGIRPVMFMDVDGKMKTLGKEYGRKNALKRVLKYVIDLEENIKDHKVIIGHTDCIEAADEMEKMLKEHFGEDLDVMKLMINPTIGGHCGPSSLGVSFHAKHK